MFGGRGQATLPLQQVKEVKQTKISCYYNRKSPKADQIRSRKCLEQQPSQETEVGVESDEPRGPTAPFWEIRGGSKDHPTAETLAKHLPSIARVGGAEARGRPTRKRPEAENRDQETLGMMAPNQSGRNKGSTRKTGLSRIQSKDKSSADVKGIRSYFEEKAGGDSSTQETEGEKERRAESTRTSSRKEPG